MGFFTSLISATVKIALTPVATVKDVVNVARGKRQMQPKTYLKVPKKTSKRQATLLGKTSQSWPD